MDRVADETIILILCLATVAGGAWLGAPAGGPEVAATLVSVCLACLCEALPAGARRPGRADAPEPHGRPGREDAAADAPSPASETPGPLPARARAAWPRWARAAAVGAWEAAALAWAPLVPFAPLAAYLAGAFRLGPLRALWAVPALAALGRGDAGVAGAALAIGAAACVLAERTRRLVEGRRATLALRDQVQERSIALARRNRDLMDRQDLEVRCAVLDERGRIAREIHDNVGHLLTRSLLQVEALRVTQAATPAAEGLAAVSATLDEALGTVRASVHDLHDGAFDARTALERAVGDWEAGDATLVYDAGPLPRPVAYAVLAVAREALSNAARHGGARAVAVELAEYPGFWRLTVADDGTGGPGSSGPADGAGEAAGMGLASMRERVEALGGTLSAGPAAAGGFAVRAIIPREREGEDE
ncbi:sensor histidine kinase [Adlercreutzia faecimuris]|uniref:histidine kinase n=1 Tax=Adlercreutzia faecimuris TaxID=2897341 RepID=A0ABS9WJY1_9ACTN|nr:histidine kinase [Adlercreutzia sp. JBNU-10]MCI2242626.1 histidine kinase [Adlercreutzia sp. JBNU-10]